MNNYIKDFGHNSEIPIKIDVAEKHYNAKYIGDFCISDKNNQWTEQPIQIYYNENPKTELGHTHYFGLFTDDFHHVYITNAISITNEPIIGAIADNGEIIYSRYRHDYQTSQDGTVFIDGGRDYCRTNTDKLINLIFDKDKLVISPDI